MKTPKPKIKNDIQELNTVCFWLIHKCLETNAETMTVNQTNVKVSGKSIGSWEIKVTKRFKLKNINGIKDESKYGSMALHQSLEERSESGVSTKVHFAT